MPENYIRWEPHWGPCQIPTSLFIRYAEARRDNQFSRSRLWREMAIPGFYRSVAYLSAKLSLIQKIVTFAIIGNVTLLRLEVIEEVWNSVGVKFRGFWPPGYCVAHRGVLDVCGFHAIQVAIRQWRPWNVGREAFWGQGVVAASLESFQWWCNVYGGFHGWSAPLILRPGALTQIWTCWRV